MYFSLSTGMHGLSSCSSWQSSSALVGQAMSFQFHPVVLVFPDVLPVSVAGFKLEVWSGKVCGSRKPANPTWGSPKGRLSIVYSQTVQLNT